MERSETVVRSGVDPGDPLGSFQSLGKNLAPQGETPLLPPRGEKLNVKFQFTGQLIQPKG